MLFKGSLFLISIATCVYADNSPALLSRTLFARSILPNACKAPGYSCQNCETSNFCYDIAPGQSIEDYQVCPKGETCKNGKCTDLENLECNPSIAKWDFECYQTGTFPHLYDCKKYFVCVKEGDAFKRLDMDCEKGYGFDPLSTMCRIKLLDDKCSEVTSSLCNKLGETGPIPGNPYLYYICFPSKEDKTYYLARVFRCSNDQEYTGLSNDFCTAKQMVLSDKKCTTNEDFYDNSCNKYKTCVIGEEPQVKTCDDGKKFSVLTNTCEFITC